MAPRVSGEWCWHRHPAEDKTCCSLVSRGTAFRLVVANVNQGWANFKYLRYEQICDSYYTISDEIVLNNSIF